MPNRPPTQTQHAYNVGKYIAFCKKRNLEMRESSIREFLISLEKESRTIANLLKSLMIFFRHVLKSDAAKSFKIPKPKQNYKRVPTREEMARFFKALPNAKYRALFLLYATSGRRRNEILSLRTGDINMKKRMLAPLDNGSATKHTWYSFYNEEEAQREQRRLCVRSLVTHRQVFREGGQKVGRPHHPQVLRDWFCNEIGRLGVQDRFVDAFCGLVHMESVADTLSMTIESNMPGTKDFSIHQETLKKELMVEIQERKLRRPSSRIR